MLVLSRKVGESVFIGDDVVVTVCSVRGDKIRLGIEAPANVQVHRQEIYNRLKAGKAPHGIPIPCPEPPASS